nr:MAG TPA: hypothetical protein [Caudoviricetes sp.]
MRARVGFPPHPLPFCLKNRKSAKSCMVLY